MFEVMARRVDFRYWKLSKAGGATPNAQQVEPRAKSFAATISGIGSASLITTRDEVSLTNWLGIPADPAAGDAAMNLSHAVAARADPVEDGPSLVAPTVGWIVATHGAATRSTQVGSDPSEVSRRLAVAMKPGSWVGISLRPPTRSETRRSRTWYEHRLGTSLPQHHSSGGHTMVMSMFAGAASEAEVRSLLTQVAASLPGFDVTIKTRVASGLAATALSAAVTAGAFGSGLYLTHGDPLIANAAAAVPSAVTVGLGLDKIPTRSSRTEAATIAGLLPTPRRRRALSRVREPAPPNPTARRGSSSRHGFDGDYPLAPDAFLVGPAVVVGLVAPHAGAVSGAATTEVRAVPKSLTERIGPMIAVGGEHDQGVHLPAADGYEGLAIVGRPGSGKSLLVRALWGWHCQERVSPAGLPGWPGSRNAMIAFESKDFSSASMYRRWAEAAGDKTMVVDFGDPSSWAIDLFAIPNDDGTGLATAPERASWFTNAMIYAFGKGDIQGRSFEALVATLTAGIATTPEVAADAGLPAGQSPIFYAYLLLGGQGDAKGLALATAIAHGAMDAERKANPLALGSGDDTHMTATTDLGWAMERLAPMYGSAGSKVTESQRRNLTEAARNKVGQLLDAEQWWSPARRKVTWDQVLVGHRSIVVNTGDSSSGKVIDEKLSGLMSSLLLYGLKSSIQRRCTGWRETGRSVTIFADELSLLAGSSPEVLTWLRNQGRYAGVRPVFATQYPEQLPADVRTAFMSFGSLLTYAQQDAGVVADLVKDLVLNGETWATPDIAGLEQYHAILRTNVAGHRQPTVPVRVPFFEGGFDTDPTGTFARFIAQQGW